MPAVEGARHRRLRQHIGLDCQSMPTSHAAVRHRVSSSTLVPLGILGPSCGLLCVIPRTAVLGAILVTGFLGGAQALQTRVSGHDGVDLSSCRTGEVIDLPQHDADLMVAERWLSPCVRRGVAWGDYHNRPHASCRLPASRGQMCRWTSRRELCTAPRFPQGFCPKLNPPGQWCHRWFPRLRTRGRSHMPTDAAVGRVEMSLKSAH
jgi:hypothetical protein